VGSAVRILLAEGNSQERRKRLADGGGTDGSVAYAKSIRLFRPDADITVIHPADGDTYLPEGTALADYDGFVLGGSGLNIPGGEDDPAVRRQVDLATAVFEAGLPFLGSCWGLQVAAAAAGGIVKASPRGREMGFARKVALTPEGRCHPLFENKTDIFDSPAIHLDEVTHLPPGSTLLATNGHSPVQAATIRFRHGMFWGVQYHPEFDLAHIAGLTRCYADDLAGEGFYADRSAAVEYADSLDVLQQDPSRRDLACLLGLDADVLDSGIRCQEIANWIERQVVPHRQARGR